MSAPAFDPAAWAPKVEALGYRLVFHCGALYINFPEEPDPSGTRSNAFIELMYELNAPGRSDENAESLNEYLRATGRVSRTPHRQVRAGAA